MTYSRFEDDKKQWSSVNISPQSKDVFSRIITAQPSTIQAYDNIYGIENTFNSNTSGAGAIAYDANLSSYTLSVGTASGDIATQESKYSHHYQPGKSQEVIMTGVLGPEKVGVVSRIGYFDDNDGMYFTMTENGPAIVVRSSTSGSVIETTVLQSQWNIDKGDGTGPSGITIDFTKFQIYYINIQWLGGGTQRFAIYVENRLVTLHMYDTFNQFTAPYMRTATLPVRYEIENIANTASSSDMLMTCASVSTVGGEEEQGIRYSYSTGLSPVTLSPNLAVFSIKQDTELNGNPYRGRTYVESIDVLNLGAAADGIQVSLVFNANISGANFQAYGPNNSCILVDSSATFNSGYARHSFYISGAKGDSAKLDTDDLILRDSNDTFTVVASNVGGATSAVFTINWREVY